MKGCIICLVAARSYTKTGLEPFTEYDFRLIISNEKSLTGSEWISFSTLQDGKIRN